MAAGATLADLILGRRDDGRATSRALAVSRRDTHTRVEAAVTAKNARERTAL